MPTYQLQSPLGAGLADAAGFMAGDTEKKRYQAEQQRQAGIDAQAAALSQSQIGKNTQDIAASKAQVTRQDLDSASTRVHQAAQDALEKAKFTYSQTHDAAVYKQEQQRINNAMTLGLGQIAASKYSADLSAKTSTAIATISAATQRRGQDVGAASERRGQDLSASTAAANRAQEGSEFSQSQATTRRGQDIGLKEYTAGYRGNVNKAFAPDLNTIKSNPTFKTLPINQQLTIQQGVTKYGAQAFLDKLQQNPNDPPPGTTPQDAQAIVQFLTGG
jgi:hypothetical protein